MSYKNYLGDTIHQSNGRLVYYSSVNALLLMNNYCKQKFHRIRLQLPDIVRYSLVLKKGSPFKKLLNEAIFRNYDTLQNITDRYLEQRICSAKELRDIEMDEYHWQNGNYSLSMPNLISCFAIELVGLLFATTFLFVEKLWQMIKSADNKMDNTNIIEQLTNAGWLLGYVPMQNEF